MKQKKSFFKQDPDEQVDLIARVWIAATIWIMVFLIAVMMMKVHNVHFINPFQSDMSHETQLEIDTSLGVATLINQSVTDVQVYHVITNQVSINDKQIMYFFKNDLLKFPRQTKILVQLVDHDAYMISPSEKYVSFGSLDTKRMNIVNERAVIHVDVYQDKISRKTNRIRRPGLDTYVARS